MVNLLNNQMDIAKIKETQNADIDNYNSFVNPTSYDNKFMLASMLANINSSSVFSYWPPVDFIAVE